jgi:hypothetical protein
MTGTRFWRLLATLLFFIGIMFGQSVRAQNAEQLGLPPVVENFGLQSPSDLPGLVEGDSGLSQSSSGSLAKKPETPINGGVLSTLDNLPPVGSSMRSDVTGQPKDVRNSEVNEVQNGAKQIEKPRIVRFGDVRSESEALKQFPELRRDSRSSQENQANSPSRVPSQPARSPQTGPLKFLDRFMPWKKPMAEPPLTDAGVESPDEYLVDKPKTASNGLSRVAIADKTDSEIQKRVDRIARQQIGNRSSSIDIEVINREVYIKARPTWFWQRRQLNDDLQNLPGVDKKRLHVTVY